jgi:hypothetical protein
MALNVLHRVTSQEKELFITTANRTSNPMLQSLDTESIVQ